MTGAQLALSLAPHPFTIQPRGTVLRSNALSKRFLCVCGFFAVGQVALANEALAEKSITKTDSYEVYTDGRAGAFVSYARGDARPGPRTSEDGTLINDVLGGGLDALAVRPRIGPNQLSQGTIENMRVRSGFIGNTFGLGVRMPHGSTTLTGYIQVWAFVESEARRKYRQNLADVRQGYVKAEGGWGTLLVGRSRALFSRAGTDVNSLYAHRYGLGYPGSTDLNGPTAGHIGFGVLGSGFAAGIAYATPVIAGLQLTTGIYDPIQLQGAWTRTKYVRPEAELTFEQPLGGLGKLVLFANGGVQNVYKEDVDEGTAAGGIGYGGRVEVGPVRVGAAGHFGKGLGLSYALEASDATIDPGGGLRKFDGYYLQSQLALGPVDLSAGWGITRVFLNPIDNERDERGNIPHSIIKYQMGISGGVVYHVTPSLHFDIDYFRANFAWFLGERQVVDIVNSGLTIVW